MATYWEVPLKAAQPQSITVTLSGVTYGMNFKWFEQARSWIVDISDVNNNPILLGVPLITGADLLEQYKHLGFVGSLWCATDGDPAAQPNFSTLGDTAHLYYVES
jgi:Domain of unknown function (DUF6983)